MEVGNVVPDVSFHPLEEVSEAKTTGGYKIHHPKFPSLRGSFGRTMQRLASRLVDLSFHPLEEVSEAVVEESEVLSVFGFHPLEEVSEERPS